MGSVNPATAFGLLHPLWLLALPPLLLLAVLGARRERDGRAWSALVDADLLAVLRLSPATIRRSLWWLVAAFWTLTVMALAGPTWQRQSSPGFHAPGAWVLVLDLSPSMGARDLSPDRVTRARYAVADLLAAARDARVALVVFAGEAHTVTPLTSDSATVQSLLPPLSPAIMPESGDQLAPALEEAGRLLAGGGATQGQVIVLSDGFADPGRSLAVAQRLRQQGATVQVVGIGTDGGAPLPDRKGALVLDSSGHTRVTRLDPDPLRRVAAAGGGRYFELSEISSLAESLQSQGIQSFGQAAGKPTALTTRVNDGFWLLPGLLLLAALFARRGWL